MLAINPYLNFPGNTEEAFNFYKSVFGGEFTTFQRFKDTAEAGKMSPEDGEKIMHVALPLAGGVTLMATDALESMGQKLVVGNNFYISVEAGSRDEADKLFRDLSEGGKIEMGMNEAFWGAYFGMFKDKFGVQWMINCIIKK
jgi:PhnB protein